MTQSALSLVSPSGMVETPRLEAKQSLAKATQVDELWVKGEIMAMVLLLSVGFEPTNYEPLAL